tara:strand:+ start:211 stop:846 length:636 start_codon:yes stop_codon:yes gene_type:complete
LINSNSKIAGIVMAGGLSRRMGENKSKKKFFNYSLIEIVSLRASKQVKFLCINSNENLKFSATKKIEIIPDFYSGNLGPLVGVLSGMKWARKKIDKIEWIVTFPVDCPFFPSTLVCDLLKDSKGCDVVIAKSNSRVHHIVAMWNINLESELEDHIRKGTRKINDFTKKFNTRVVNFSVIGYDPFFNINNLDDYSQAKEIYTENFYNKEEFK